jgi:hypothetical protein
MISAENVIVDLLQRGHAVEFEARGDSMHPVIRSSDVLHIEVCRDPRIGDVVLTLADRGLTAHRVVQLRGDAIVTRGDNAPADDPPLVLSRVLGRVTRVTRAGAERGVGREPLLLRCARRLLR